MKVVYDGQDTIGHSSNGYDIHELKCFDDQGFLLIVYPCFNESVADNAWRSDAGCPPGTYTLGAPEPCDPGEEQTSMGLWFVPVYSIPDHSGIGVHGGGSASSDPLAKQQGWFPTENCFRMQNEDLVHFVQLLKSVSGTISFEVVQS
jgi:hypothetical protein